MRRAASSGCLAASLCEACRWAERSLAFCGMTTALAGGHGGCWRVGVSLTVGNVRNRISPYECMSNILLTHGQRRRGISSTFPARTPCGQPALQRGGTPHLNLTAQRQNEGNGTAQNPGPLQVELGLHPPLNGRRALDFFAALDFFVERLVCLL
jgi:hypothetical protein